MPSKSASDLTSADPLPTPATPWAGWAIATIAVVLGNAFILIRAANIATPLYGGDEIAYWHNARALFAGVNPAAFNIYLQQINCDLFYLMVGWLAQRPDGAFTMRLLNYMMIVLTAFLVYGAARTVLPRSWSAAAAALVFITGTSVWMISTMPETTYTFLFALLAFVIVRLWAPGRLFASLAVGVLTGALMLTKPHGIAIALACMATMLAIPLLHHRNVRTVRVATTDVLMLAVGLILSVVAVSSFARGELVVSPSKLIGSLYANILSSSDPRSFARLLEVAYYWLAHTVALTMLFSPALVLSVRLIARSLGTASRLDTPQQRTLVLALFLGFCAVSIFAMTAVFTEAVGLRSDFERWRIHGRYWTFLMPWLAILAFVSFSSAAQAGSTAWTDRAVGLLGLAATLVFVLIISQRFSLYPWDFPELFGFYRADLQNWKMQLLWLPHAFAISFFVLLLSSAAWIYGMGGRGMVYAAALVAVFIAGNVSTTQWQFEAADIFSPRVTSGIAARRIVGEQSEGALVGASFWGQGLSFLAYNLPLRSHVIQKPASSTLSEADLPAGAQWVMTAGSYDIGFTYRHAIPLAAATLYLRDVAPQR